MKANGLMEASTIAAILLGSVAGGVPADWHVLVALAACALAYGGAVVARSTFPNWRRRVRGSPESHQHDPQFPECLHLAMAQW